MKRFFALASIVILAGLSWAHAQDLDDQYIAVFNLIQEGDKLNADLPNQALAKYLQAQSGLQKIQKANPKWNAGVVTFRLNYLAGQIAILATKVPMPVVPSEGTNSATAGSATNTAAPNAKSSAPVDWDTQVRSLRDQIRQLQQDKGLLEAKLKEALSQQPAAVDPHELAQAKEKITGLLKENDLLKSSLELEKAKPASPTQTKALDQARVELAEQKELATKLALAKDTAESRLQALTTEAEAATALRAENQLIKKQLADLQADSSATATKASESARQLAEAQTQIAALQSDKEILRLEKSAVEDRFKQLGAAKPGAPAPVVTSADASRIKHLERERDDLQRKLEAANKELYARKGKGATARVDDLETQLGIVRARLAIFEARAAPYSTEELALLKAPETKVAEQDTNARKKPIRELPAGSAKLVAEAQTFFSNRQYDKAEAAYLQVLHQDKQSIPALANLAAIQVEAQHFDAAQENLKQALILDPEDPYTLYVAGILYFRQHKYDDALDALSHAAKLDPENAEVQNYLGLTLSEKGMRGPAETALRKAVELQPDYAGAHHNLAVFYITQKPPYSALARWHYDKAIAAGHPHHAELEKLLDDKR